MSRQRRIARIRSLTVAGTALVAGILVAAGLPPGAGVRPAHAADAGVFQDFESDADLSGITVSLPDVDSATRAAYSSHGDSSVEFVVGPANSPGATASSGITFHAGTPSLPLTDWSGHAAVGWDFFTDLGYDTVGRVTIRDSHNKAWGADYPIHARGWTAFDAKISTLQAAGLDVSSISYIGISMPRADRPVAGYYDAFRLSDDYPYDETGYADRAAASLVRLLPFGSIVGNLGRQLDTLDQRLGDRSDAIDRRLTAQLDDEHGRIGALKDTLARGISSYQAYASFNSAVATAERAVPRLANTIDARLDAPSSDFGLASADSMSLVYPRDLPFTSTGPTPSISLAEGEFENLQAVVIPYAEALGKVSARVSSVQGPGGPASSSDLAVTVHPVGFLNVTPSSSYHRPVYTGWTPDPIRDDLASVDVAAADFQPYWIQVKAGEKARPGTYTINVAFSADGKRSRSMAISVRVWPFGIDQQPKLATAFQYTPDITASLYGITDPAAKEALKHQYWSFLNDFKIEPDQIYTVDGDPAIPGGYTIRPTPVEDVLYIKDHYGLRRFNALYLYAGLLDPNKPDTWQAQIDTWMGQLDTAMAAYERAGVAQYAYVYGFDEASGPMLQAAKQTFTAIKARYPDLPIMTTLRDNSMGVNTGLTDLVDIWAPQQDLYDQSVAERTRARGAQAWWYPDIATGYPLPNWFNGYPPIDGRMLMGPMSYKAGVEGVLYYATNHWTYSSHAAQPLVNDGIYSQWNAATFGTTAGDGSIFYPGPNGPMASIRIQNIRDGMEDYNLLAELRHQLDTHPGAADPVRRRAERALAAGAVVTNQRSFTENAAAYRTWRNQVAQSIIELR